MTREYFFCIDFFGIFPSENVDIPTKMPATFGAGCFENRFFCFSAPLLRGAAFAEHV